MLLLFLLYLYVGTTLFYFSSLLILVEMTSMKQLFGWFLKLLPIIFLVYFAPSVLDTDEENRCEMTWMFPNYQVRGGGGGGGGGYYRSIGLLLEGSSSGVGMERKVVLDLIWQN